MERVVAEPGSESRTGTLRGTLRVRAGDDLIGTRELSRIIQTNRRRASGLLELGRIPSSLVAGRLVTTRRHAEWLRDVLGPPPRAPRPTFDERVERFRELLRERETSP
jgi:hypothetical protein